MFNAVPTCVLQLKKVQVERHRRERINRSMSALRDLVCQGQPDQVSNSHLTHCLLTPYSLFTHCMFQTSFSRTAWCEFLFIYLKLGFKVWQT